MAKKKKPWKPWEDAFLREHAADMTASEIAAALKRTENSVSCRKSLLGLTNLRPPGRTWNCRRPELPKHKSTYKKWRPADDELLMEYWGKFSIPTIANKLGRSVSAIKTRAGKLHLGSSLMAGDFVTLNKLVKALRNANVSAGYHVESWCKNRGLPIHTHKVDTESFRVVYLDEFWKWAEKHRSFLDFSKMEPLALGAEPDWVPEQRRKDFQAFALQRKDPWAPDEDSRLKMLLKQQRYGYAELSEMLRRSEGAIVRRCRDLGLKERPVRADNHGADSVWTEEHFRILADGIRHGDAYPIIGKAIGRSEKAVRGKVYFTYLTENADKVRAYMGDGPWGHGAPEPTIRQGLTLSRTRTEVRQNLSILDALLRKRMNDLGYDPYWQRFMCMNWDDVGGCSAGCADCDACTEFRRIRPQYCARCGSTFYERKENRFCKSCRTARKKQYLRKYARLHAQSRG